jgi:hypothetical protein
MRSLFRCRVSGAAARAHQGSRLRQATGPGRATRLAGRADPCAPWRYQAGRAVPGLVPGAVSRAPGSRALPEGRCAGRAASGRPLRCRRGRPVGVFRGPFPRRVGRGPAVGAVAVAGPVRSETGLPAAGPRGAARARRSWSGRSSRGGLCGGPIVGPEWRTPGELPTLACAARPRLADQTVPLLPSPTPCGLPGKDTGRQLRRGVRAARVRSEAAVPGKSREIPGEVPAEFHEHAGCTQGCCRSRCRCSGGLRRASWRFPHVGGCGLSLALSARGAVAAPSRLAGRCPLWAFRLPYTVTLRDGTGPRSAPSPATGCSPLGFPGPQRLRAAVPSR